MESNLARSLALSGKKAKARALAERLHGEGLAPYRSATIEAAMGENEGAVKSLKLALEVRDPWLVVMKVDPMIDAIRKDRRVRDIEKEVFRA